MALAPLSYFSQLRYNESMNLTSKLPIFNLPLAFTDLETTGLRAGYHEIIEFGLVIVEQETLKVLDEWEAKVIPARPERAMPSSLVINGYNDAEWVDAAGLQEATKEYAKRAQGGLLAGWNIRFDVQFLSRAFEESELDIYKTMDYHAFDVMSLAFEALRENPPARFSLNAVATHVGLEPEPSTHRALNGARQAFEVYKKLRQSV